ncbi:MAG: acetyl-CoA carboxylase carboxyltransferase subunit alpha [Pelagibacteraceae bacterium]|jgi:acetyl-CoA carboxylase carboxyl transferase subunit alpha|nr:acetyl-CoA carboxylase carboxyltransferase subunit alpha [Pelagibacteraceae bacterium]MBT4951966.1 acetyl-CoA carboxylase carboxyltransferase subunit alpha [Pelagibacteraceae bacterium]MBT6197546.1 acetyl-CoA carboxylase carboxyltransferase subunit alpha [Pelagibacteraceae bacterium]MBT6354126.1 acetyl-CoA carboxylase carboxyltransferase subunit alpha [Pelagibacteraceae bacterium]
MNRYFDFESDVEKIDIQINKLNSNDNNYNNQKTKLLEKKNFLLKKIYSNLSAWEKVQVARHANRPHALDYINLIFKNIVYLHGDKKFSDDSAILGCLADLSGQSVIVIGTEKGNSMDTRIKHNFGMAKPEGYRKAQRLMMIANKFNLPVITLVDTAGAFPGKEAEERGQSESIASSILVSLKIDSPIISVVIGEGGSGGAIALATADKVLMLEHSIYSVISPEGCASILWRNSDFIQKAAENLKITAQDCLFNKIIDSVVKEVPGGAHRNPDEQAQILKKELISNLETLNSLTSESLKNIRNEKYLNITSAN